MSMDSVLVAVSNCLVRTDEVRHFVKKFGIEKRLVTHPDTTPAAI